MEKWTGARKDLICPVRNSDLLRSQCGSGDTDCYIGAESIVRRFYHSQGEK